MVIHFLQGIMNLQREVKLQINEILTEMNPNQRKKTKDKS